jgi:hypothetical protein
MPFPDHRDVPVAHRRENRKCLLAYRPLVSNM